MAMTKQAQAYLDWYNRTKVNRVVGDATRIASIVRGPISRGASRTSDSGNKLNNDQTGGTGTSLTGGNSTLRKYASLTPGSSYEDIRNYAKNTQPEPGLSPGADYETVRDTQNNVNSKVTARDREFYDMYTPYYKDIITPEEWYSSGETNPYEYYIGDLRERPADKNDKPYVPSEKPYVPSDKPATGTTEPTTPTDPGTTEPEETHPGSYAAGNIGDWYRHFYGEDFSGQMPGSKPDWMSDADWQNGMDAYDLYRQQELANQLYDSRRKNVEDWYRSVASGINSSSALQKEHAAALYNRLLKYLPVQNRALGISNLGVAQSTGLRALSTYSDRLSQIGQQEGEALSNADRSRLDKLQSIEEASQSSKLKNAQSEASLRNSRYATLLNEKKAGQSQAVSNLLQAISAGASAEDVQKLYEEYDSKGLIPEENRSYIGTIMKKAGTLSASTTNPLDLLNTYIKLKPSSEALNAAMTRYLDSPNIDEETKRQIQAMIAIYKSSVENDEFGFD